MAFNPASLIKLKGRYKIFKEQHPKFLQFFKTVGLGAVKEGTVLEVKFKEPDGKASVANIKLTADDVETVNMLLKTK